VVARASEDLCTTAQIGGALLALVRGGIALTDLLIGASAV